MGDFLDYQLQYASLEDLEAIFVPRYERRNPFKPVKEITMSNEQRTRVEIVQAMAEQCKMLSAMGEALTMLLNDVVETTVVSETPLMDAQRKLDAKEKMARVRAARKAKANGAPPVEMLPANPPTPPVMPDVVPIVPTKGLGDLRAALQDCITKHGMPEAKERLAPYLKVSEVPDEAIVKVISKLGE